MSQAPYAEVLAGRDPQKVIAQTPRRLSKVLDALTPEQIETPSAPGKWTVREIIAHLADCEIAWAWRLRQALAEEHAQMQPFDQDTWAKPYANYSLAEAWGTFRAVRKWNIAFIKAVSHDDRKRPIFHPERGEETLWTLVEIMAGHDLHHLQSLEKITPAPR